MNGPATEPLVVIRDLSVAFAVSGERSHGLDYAEEAIRKGAVVVLFEPESRTGPEKERLGTRGTPLAAHPVSGVGLGRRCLIEVPNLTWPVVLRVHHLYDKVELHCLSQPLDGGNIAN